MGQGGVLQVRVDLLDDRVVAVGLVGGHGVGEVGVGGGEERVEAPQVEQGVLTRVGCRVQFGDTAHDQASGHVVGLLLGGEGGEGDFGDFRAGDPPSGGL